MADQLAKEGSKLPQEYNFISFNEAKTIIKSNTEDLWKESHPAFNPKDPYYQLSRQEQVLIFRLRTKHNRLRHHLFHSSELDKVTNAHVVLALKQQSIFFRHARY